MEKGEILIRLWLPLVAAISGLIAADIVMQITVFKSGTKVFAIITFVVVYIVLLRFYRWCFKDFFRKKGTKLTKQKPKNVERSY